MHDLVGASLPLKRSGDTPWQGMSPINVGDLRQVSQVKNNICFEALDYQNVLNLVKGLALNHLNG